MKRADLKEATSIGTASMAKLGKGENMTTAELRMICNGLNLDLSDIMVTVEESSNDKQMALQVVSGANLK